MALNLGNLLAGAARAASLNAMQQAFAPDPPPVYSPPPAPRYVAPALETMQQAFAPVAQVAQDAVMQAAAQAAPPVPAPPPPPSFFATMQKALAANPVQGFAGSGGDVPTTRAAGGNQDWIPPDQRTLGNWIGAMASPAGLNAAHDAFTFTAGALPHTRNPRRSPMFDRMDAILFDQFAGQQANSAMTTAIGPAKQARAATNAITGGPLGQQLAVYEDGTYNLPFGVDPIQVTVTVQNPVTGATQQVPVSTLATWVNNGWAYVGGSERVGAPNTEKRGQRKE